MIRDISILLREGSSPCQISEILGISPEVVRMHVARLGGDTRKTREDFPIPGYYQDKVAISVFYSLS